MEIDVTSLVIDTDTWTLSGSIATHGKDVAKETWAAANEQAGVTPYLDTPAKLAAMRAWMKGTGAWDKAERDAMSDVELNALFIQLVSGDMREMGLDQQNAHEFDWDAYRERSDGGGSLYVGDVEGSDGFGRYFYYLGT